MSKAVWVILILLIAIDLFPSSVIKKREVFEFDRPRNEGYVAFIVNENTEENNDNNNDDDNDNTTCKCNGTEVIIHGDGHKTPCKCINEGGECNCSKKQIQLNAPIVTPNKTDWNSLDQQH